MGAGPVFEPGTYTLFDFAGAASTGVELTDFVLGAKPTGYDHSVGLTAGALTLTVVSSLPEPSTGAIFGGLGVLGAALVARRRRPAS